MKEIIRRIDNLFREVNKGKKEIPTLEQFCKEWAQMDELSRSVYVAFAECPDLYGEVDQYHKVVFGYLEQMGLVKEHYILQGGEIVRKT